MKIRVYYMFVYKVLREGIEMIGEI